MHVCVSVSVTKLAATYLVYKSQVRCYKVHYGVVNIAIYDCVDLAENASFKSFGVY